MELSPLKNKRCALITVPLSLTLYLFLFLGRWSKNRAYTNEKMNDARSLIASRQRTAEELVAFLLTFSVYEGTNACE